MSGALPADRASRPTAQAPAGLGDTATIPSAWRFADVAALALRAFDREPSEYIAVSASIKYLQRQGVAPSYSTGRGRKASYTEEDVFRILVGLELHSIGLTPIQIEPIMSRHWQQMRECVEAGKDARISIRTALDRQVSLEIEVTRLAQAMSASGQDPKGLEAKPASAVPEGNAP